MEDGLEYIKVTPTSPILYPSAEYIREKVMQSNVDLGKNPKVFVFDCRKMNRADFTAAKVKPCNICIVWFFYVCFVVYRSIDKRFKEDGKNGRFLWTGKKCG